MKPPIVRTEAEPLADLSALTRRAALKLTAVALAGAAFGVGATALLTRASDPRVPRYRVLSDKEASLLGAICDQLIPRDEAAGALEAEVVVFIDRQLSGPYASHQEAYRRGLESFTRTCQERHGQPFAELTAGEKIALLESVERGEVPNGLWDKPSARAFFNLVLAHTMQGYYGSPRHGGNRDFASYRMLELELPQVVGRTAPRRTRS